MQENKQTLGLFTSKGRRGDRYPWSVLRSHGKERKLSQRDPPRLPRPRSDFGSKIQALKLQQWWERALEQTLELTFGEEDEDRRKGLKSPLFPSKPA